MILSIFQNKTRIIGCGGCSPCWIGRLRESCDPLPVLPPNPKCGFRGRRMEIWNETRDRETTRQATAYCRLSGWVAGEGQCVEGVTVRERGGVVRIDAVRVG